MKIVISSDTNPDTNLSFDYIKAHAGVYEQSNFPTMVFVSDGFNTVITFDKETMGGPCKGWERYTFSRSRKTLTISN